VTGSSDQINDTLMQRIAHAFVDAANRRDPEALTVLFDSDAEFRPSVLVGSRSSYRGHDGVRRYFEELRPVDRDQWVRMREIRRISGDQFVLLTEVMLGSEPVSPAAIILCIEDGKIIKATAHLSDEATLVAVGLLPS
jgi:hypothetical protein